MLLEALSIPAGACVAMVGAGGKTTLCWRLVQELATLGQRAIFTTTTKIWRSADGAFDWEWIAQKVPSISEMSGPWHTACLAKAIEGEVNNTPINGSFMPVVQTKLMGFAPAEICEFRQSLITNPQSPITLIVEADGARGLRLKAPGEGEPLIPPCADVVCVLANLDALGRPLDDRIAHRVNLVASLTKTMPGSIITAPLVAALLTHAEGGLKHIPPSARKIAVLTQHSANAIHPDADDLMQALVRGGFDEVVTIAPRADAAILGTTSLRGMSSLMA